MPQMLLKIAQSVASPRFSVTKTFGLSMSTTEMSSSRKEHLDLTKLQWRDPDTVPATVVSVSDISKTVKSLTLKVDDDIIQKTGLSFKAGQWLDFFIPGEPQVGGFSMTSSPHRLQTLGTVDLAVKASSWPPARWIHTKCKKGDTVAFRFGGEFYYASQMNSKPHSLLLIAGGVGINPLYSIFQHVAQTENGNPSSYLTKLTLLFSAASADELLFRNTIDECVSKNSKLKAEYFVTREENSLFTNRRITKDDIAERLSSSSASDCSICYICGPPDMVGQTSQWLQELNVSKENIRFELWW